MGFLDYLDQYEEKLKKVEKKEEPKKPVIKKITVKTEEFKKPFKIPPKKVIKNPIQEAHNRAVSILDGMPEDEVIEENEILQQNDEYTNVVPQQPKEFKTVKSHAAALL
jgi:hypothetical protein